MLSLYGIIKPPRAGNCTIDEAQNPKLLIAISDFKEIFKKEATISQQKLLEIKTKLDDILECEEWEADEFLNLTEHDYANSQTVDSIIYYVTGFTYFISF